MRIAPFLSALVLVLVGTVDADIRLPAVFSDHMVLQRDEPIRIWGWATDGEQVRVRLAGQERVTFAYDNAWTVTLEPLPAGAEPLELVVEGFNRVIVRDILVGEVWLASGQSNMKLAVGATSHAEASLARADVPTLRLFKVEEICADRPLDDVGGAWARSNAEVATDFSAVAFHFGLELQAELGVPVGIVQSCVGGTRAVNWTSAPVLAVNPDARHHDDYYRELLRAYPEKVDAWRARVDAGETNERQPTKPHRRRPAGYFNGMIHGLVGFPLRGVIWYQGETDTWNAEQYARMFPDLITDWRTRWGQGDFPFLYVQLPGFNGKPGVDVNYPFLREIQREIEPTLPHLGMAVTIDQGEEDDIHPREKREVAHRLALLARRDVYGEDVIASGPRPAEVEFAGTEARMRWTEVAGGLEVRGDALRGFALAGKDGLFHPAEASLEGDSVIVTAPAVPQPTYLRYSFRGFPDGNLFNSAGLPAVPFRTDDFARGEGAVTSVPE